MRKFVLAAVVLFPLVVFNSSAGDFILNLDDSIYNVRDLNIPSPRMAQQEIKANFKKLPRKKWTIMVFINGKNDLEIAGLFNVNQMEAVGSDENINIVVELGRMKGQQGDTELDGNWTGSRRLFIKKDDDGEKITSPIVMETQNVDMGDYKRVADFVKWSKENFPAKRYMLVLWDHGTGWLDPQMEKMPEVGKGISFDSETGNYIRTRQIAEILKEAGKVDILAFDACLMQMIEVAYESRDYADVIIGSEEVEPAYGYPYDIFLKVLEKYPTLNATEFSKVIVMAHKKFYRDLVKKASMLSAVKAKNLKKFAKLSGEFASLVMKVNDTEAVQNARKEVIRYDILGPKSDPNKTITFFGDLIHFAKLVSSNLTKTGSHASALKDKVRELAEFGRDKLFTDYYGTGNERTGKALSISGGISVYLPPVETKISQEKLEGIFEGKYEDFAFSKASGWHDFATYIYNIKPEPQETAEKSKCVDPGKDATFQEKLKYRLCKNREEFEATHSVNK